MHEMLAISASHRATLNPVQQTFFEHQATELQTHALLLFNSRSDDNSDMDCAPRFLFSSLLGIHVLHETLKFRHTDFGVILDKVVQYLRLTQGVRLQIGDSWPLLLQTGLKTFLDDGERLPTEENAFLPELDELEGLLKAANLDAPTLQIYRNALAKLKVVFHVPSTVDTEAQDTARHPFAWPVVVSPDYTNLVLQRRPEALVILAHYAALLHWYRGMWIIGDGAQYLVEMITRYLGTYWEAWLTWPTAVIAECTDTFGPSSAYHTPVPLS